MFLTSLSQNDADALQLPELKEHEYGVFHLGADGVVRSYHPNGTVLDYAKLSPAQIAARLKIWGKDENLTEAFEGVNGHDVVDEEQLLNPGKALLPHQFKYLKEPKTGPASNCGGQRRDIEGEYQCSSSRLLRYSRMYPLILGARRCWLRC